MEHEALGQEKRPVVTLTRTNPEFCADHAIALTFQKYPKYRNIIFSDLNTE